MTSNFENFNNFDLERVHLDWGNRLDSFKSNHAFPSFGSSSMSRQVNTTLPSLMAGDEFKCLINGGPKAIGGPSQKTHVRLN